MEPDPGSRLKLMCGLGVELPALSLRDRASIPSIWFRSQEQADEQEVLQEGHALQGLPEAEEEKVVVEVSVLRT